MQWHSRPRDSERPRWDRPEVVQTKLCSGQRVLCFFVDGAQATEGHESTNRPKEAPEGSSTHRFANLAKKISVESRGLGHGSGQVVRQHPRRRLSKRVFFHHPDHLTRLKARGQITHRFKAKRPWLLAGIGRTMGGSAKLLPDPSDDGDVSKQLGRDIFHHGGPCSSTEPSGSPIKARGRGFVFLQPLITHFSRSLEPQDNKFTTSSRSTPWDVSVCLPQLPVPVRMLLFPSFWRKKTLLSHRYLKSPPFGSSRCLWFPPDSKRCRDQPAVSNLLQARPATCGNA
jgi:hypothetical protein